MDPECVDKTVFVTFDDVDLWRRMAFGMENDGATFRCSMFMALKGLEYNGVIWYLDNVTTYGTTFEQMVLSCRQVSI